MATVYSLICWGGSAGKSVTVSNTTDLVTLTNHGLRNATGVAFTSGTLPTVSGTALALNTTYYAKSISISTFELYYDSGLTSKIDFTSTGSSLIMKSAYYLGLSDKSRWTTGGVERIYQGVGEWVSGRAAASALDEEVGEIGQAFTDIRGTAVTLNIPSGAVRLESRVNGARTSAFHYGVVSTSTADAGYVLVQQGSNTTCLNVTAKNCTVDGITVRHTNSGDGIVLNAFAARVLNCISVGAGVTTGYGIANSQAGTEAINCISQGWSVGWFIPQYAAGIMIANCTVTKCTTGMPAQSNIHGAMVVNTVIVGNTTTDWGAGAPGYATNNAGLSGQAWLTGSNPRYTIATTDFADHTNNDYRAAAVTSVQVEQGAAFYGAPLDDVAGNIRPFYPGSNYNTAVTAGSFVTGLSYTIAVVGTTDFTAIGASANTVGVRFKATGAGSGTGTATLNAQYDIGAYEYDLGYGAWPATFTLTIDNVVVGSAIRIEESDGTLIEFRTATGTAEVFTMGASLGTITIKIRKGTSGTKYLPYETQTTAFDGSASIYVSQVADTIAA